MEFDINDIFKIEHSFANLENDFTPIVELNNDKYLKVIKDFELDNKYFFVVKNKLHPFCYFKNTVYIEIYEMSYEFFKEFEIKEKITRQQERHERLIKQNDFEKLFCLIDKPLRIECYKKLFNQIPDDQKYEVFKFIYISSEYGFNSLSKDFIKVIASYNTSNKNWFEKEILTIYRGEGELSTPYTEALSWTKSLRIAKRFANRFEDNGVVYKAKVKQSDIIDYLTDRNEDEILVLPENVFNIEEIE